MLGKLLRNYVLMLIILLATDWLLPNFSFGYPVGNAFSFEAFGAHLSTLLLVALILTLLGMFARPILKILGAPINFLTLGLFGVLINMLFFWLAVYLVPGFSITALSIGGLQLNLFFSYAAVAVVFGFVQGLLALLV